MSNLAVQSQPQPPAAFSVHSMDDLYRLSDMMSKSGFFDDCKSAAQAGVKILAGLELGIPAFAALSGIHLIKGKPAIGANVMAAMIKRSGKYNYRVLEHTEKSCRIAFYEGKEQLGVSEFTADDAARMGTQNMNKFPKNMLFARAISNGIKFHCPDLFLGAPVYTPEELGAEIDEDGEVINATVLEASSSVHGSERERIAARLDDIAKRTGFDFTRLTSIAVKQKPSIHLPEMSNSDCDRLRDAVYAAWAYEQKNAFQAPKHAWNAYQQHLKTMSDHSDDAEIWDSWEIEVAQRVAAATATATEGEEEF